MKEDKSGQVIEKHYRYLNNDWNAMDINERVFDGLFDVLCDLHIIDQEYYRHIIYNISPMLFVDREE